jgi:hypothetical protein
VSAWLPTPRIITDPSPPRSQFHKSIISSQIEVLKRAKPLMLENQHESVAQVQHSQPNNSFTITIRFAAIFYC